MWVGWLLLCFSALAGALVPLKVPTQRQYSLSGPWIRIGGAAERRGSRLAMEGSVYPNVPEYQCV